MALSTPASIGGATARSYTEGIIKKGSDVRGKLVEWTLLATLTLSLLILLVLLVDLIRKAWSVLTDRPREFLGGGLNSSDATEAGVWQGIVGTVMLCIVEGDASKIARINIVGTKAFTESAAAAAR